MKQLHSEISKFKTLTFSTEKSETISVLCCLPFAKFNIILECLLPYTHPIKYAKCIGSGIETIVKQNKPWTLMTVCGHGFRNDVMTYMLQFGESTIYRIFAAWIVFVNAIFSCLNLKTDDRFLSYSIFNKTGHGLTDFTITWDEFKPVLHPEVFESKTVHISTVC